mmetsp:Transcript_3902/g.5119  ORF Transcript_3902/g.5119 Transcript_3902/m.5119 type:complete len:555 (-) Transcript_3902:125-1789(-)|eukprot:CAMPEP_0198144798 /NCGR_PEP_ID=MMETSP1443-20131203/18679_1 /TAXON_ID=186043 /ORGANISM="Entomoneis sp., Strain CCMP2396" /LENGTH=554 /DNA_ID=CAMNT_0043808261 /DNA_START=34 /DNA_END=1698 /DNA_ORIENTATION=-
MTKEAQKKQENHTHLHDDDETRIELGSAARKSDDAVGQNAVPLSSSIRSTLGKGSLQCSDFVNNHLAEVRFMATAGIGLLAAYGLSQTPLFFRYRTVSDLPSSFFRQRKLIRGRLVKVWVDKNSSSTKQSARPTTTTTISSSLSGISKKKDPFGFPEDMDNDALVKEEKEDLVKDTSLLSENNQALSFPIKCQIRHASPIEALLSKSWFNQLMRLHPSSSTLGVRPDENEDQLLVVEIAGIRSLCVPNQQQQQQQRSSSSILASMNQEMIQGVSSSGGSSPSLYHEDKNTHSSFPFSKNVPTELEWLELLAQERPLVSCQLMGRRVPIIKSGGGGNTSGSKDELFNSTGSLSNKRRIPGFEHHEEEEEQQQQQQSKSSNNSPLQLLDQQHASSSNDHDDDPVLPQIAIGRLFYRAAPSSSVMDVFKQFIFPTDLALSLVRMGRASVMSGDEGLVAASSSSTTMTTATSTNSPLQKHQHQVSYRVMDTTESVRDLHKDVAYVEELHKAEFQAVAEQRGMWQKPFFRALRADIVNEVEFQTKAPWYQKMWRWARGG